MDGKVHHHSNTSNPLATSLSTSFSSSTTTISPSLLNNRCRWSVHEWWILLPAPSSSACPPPCPRPQPPPPSPLLKSTRSTHGLYSELKRVPLISASWLNSCCRNFLHLASCSIAACAFLFTTSSCPLIKCYFMIMGGGKSDITIVVLWETTTPSYAQQILCHTSTVYHASLWNQSTNTVTSL